MTQLSEYAEFIQKVIGIHPDQHPECTWNDQLYAWCPACDKWFHPVTSRCGDSYCKTCKLEWYGNDAYFEKEGKRLLEAWSELS